MCAATPYTLSASWTSINYKHFNYISKPRKRARVSPCLWEQSDSPQYLCVSGFVDRRTAWNDSVWYYCLGPCQSKETQDADFPSQLLRLKVKSEQCVSSHGKLSHMKGKWGHGSERMKAPNAETSTENTLCLTRMSSDSPNVGSNSVWKIHIHLHDSCEGISELKVRFTPK